MQSRSIYNTHHNFAIVSTTLHSFDKRGGSLLQRSWSVHRHQIVIIIICCFFYITLHCQGTSSAVLHQCHTPCYFHQEQKLGVEDSTMDAMVPNDAFMESQLNLVTKCGC